LQGAWTVSREHDDDFLEDDEEEEFASRSIFAAGWFRAVLVLTVLAIVLVVSLPWLLNWLDSPTPPAHTAGPVDTPPAAPPPATRATAPEPAPSTSPSPAPGTADAPPQPPAVKPAPPPPARKQTAEPSATDRVASPGQTARTAERNGASGPASGSGQYWVQLGAFKEEKNAEAMVRALREAGIPVDVSRVTRASGEGPGVPQQHELFVTDAGVERVNAALKGRGSAQSAPGGVTVKPAFDLEEAMTISRRLTDQGLKVIIRPAGIGGGAADGGVTLHVVRAGGYPDRARALAAREAIRAEGLGTGIVTRGPAR
jgi:hypothetical protein